jgi:hypothetical protein
LPLFAPRAVRIESRPTFRRYETARDCRRLRVLGQAKSVTTRVWPFTHHSQLFHKEIFSQNLALVLPELVHFYSESVIARTLLLGSILSRAEIFLFCPVENTFLAKDGLSPFLNAIRSCFAY